MRGSRKINPALRATISFGHSARDRERIDSEVDLPLDADIPLIALILAGYIVHVVVANFWNKEDARGKGDNRRNINDPGIDLSGSKQERSRPCFGEEVAVSNG